MISLRSHLRASLNRCKIFKKAVIRSIFLICLGLVLNSGKRSDVGIRLPGVLQRIGLTYLILASVEIFLSRPQRNELVRFYFFKLYLFLKYVLVWALE